MSYSQNSKNIILPDKLFQLLTSRNPATQKWYPKKKTSRNQHQQNQAQAITMKKIKYNKIKNILKSKLTKIEERIDSVKKKITKQQEEFISSIKKVKESVKLSLDIGQSNSTKVS